ncbi:putative RNA-directed DNA polymerase, eukaryota, reverse transcriptase zinc-binding domain protein, partial [Tanacetum coccineum]
MCSRWKWTSNGSLCSKGTRIILGWNDDLVDVMIMAQTNQVMHIQLTVAIFSMGDDRAPGPDGFTVAFFKKAWDVVGGDITCAIQDFFSNGKLLKELNHTIISLIPKIIANRVKEGLGDIVSINQSAFVPDRRISDNILLTQELMRNYHRRRGPHRCAFKVDIQKAYDTMDWSFLESILVGFGFHPKMIQWI